MYPGIGFEFVYLTDSIALKAEIQKQEEMLKSNWIFFSDPKKMIVRINQGSLDFAINSIEEITETNDMLFDIERIKPYVQEYSEYRKFRAEIKKNENNNSGIKTNTDNMSSWIEIYQVTTKSKSNLFIFNFITQERSKIFPERVDQKIYVFVEKNNYINDLKDYVKNN